MSSAEERIRVIGRRKFRVLAVRAGEKTDAEGRSVGDDWLLASLGYDPLLNGEVYITTNSLHGSDIPPIADPLPLAMVVTTLLNSPDLLSIVMARYEEEDGLSGGTQPSPSLGLVGSHLLKSLWHFEAALNAASSLEYGQSRTAFHSAQRVAVTMSVATAQAGLARTYARGAESAIGTQAEELLSNGVRLEEKHLDEVLQEGRRVAKELLPNQE